MTVCRNRSATLNELVVSANAAETAINTAQTIDTLMLCNMDNFLSVTPRREINTNQATGKEEPTKQYDLGYEGGGSLNFDTGESQHFAFLCAYGLGSIATVVAGTEGGTVIYDHTITPIADFKGCTYSNPLFTAAQKYSNILKRRFYSCFVKSFTVNLEKDSWAKISGEIGATARFDDNYITESQTLAESVTSITAASSVLGSDSTDRLRSIDYIRADMGTDGKTYLSPSVVSSATPAVITVPAAGTGATSRVFELAYLPKQPSWCTFPSVVDETPLRTTDFAMVVGGYYDGTNIVGGSTVSGEAQSVTWNFTNEGLEAEYVPGGSGSYANRAIRQRRAQTLSFARDMMNNQMQQHMKDNDDIAVKLKAEGAVIVSGQSSKYTVEILFPKCRVNNPSSNVDGTLMSEAVEMAVLQHATHPSVVVKVKNAVSAYAA
jgi:hypothetical protein